MKWRDCFAMQEGFTLIELMVTLALVGLVITGGFSLYFFADRSFLTGQVVADVQADIQIAMQRISEEARLAHSLEIIPVKEAINASSLKEDDHYLFSRDGEVILKTERGERTIIGDDRDFAQYGLLFSRVGGEGLESVLAIKLSSLNPEVDYTLESDLQILNLRQSGSVLKGGIEGIDSSEAIYFTKTFTEEELETKDPRRCFLRRHVFHEGAEEILVLRRFRDNVLMTNKLGRLVTDLYYTSSPAIGSLLERQPLALLATRSIFRGIASLVAHVS